MSITEKVNGKPDPDLWGQWNKSISKAGPILRGTSFSFRVDTNGKITDFRGMEAIRKKLKDAAKKSRNDTFEGLADARFNSQYWQPLLEDYTTGLSSQPLQQGSHWQYTPPASLSFLQPLHIQRKVKLLNFNSARLVDTGTINVDTTPKKSQGYRDTAIYTFKYKGHFERNWTLNWDKQWQLVATSTTQSTGESTIYGASKQGDLTLYTRTPMILKEESRLVVLRQH